MAFSYFGSKRNPRLLNQYPPPKHQLIVEPFAGSAAYSCKWGVDRDVWINDKYGVVYRIWKWIQGATRRDVLSLPSLSPGMI